MKIELDINDYDYVDAVFLAAINEMLDDTKYPHTSPHPEDVAYCKKLRKALKTVKEYVGG